MPPKDTKKEAPKAAAAAAPAKKTATPKAPHTTHLFARGFRGQRGHKLSKRTVPRRNVHNKGVSYLNEIQLFEFDYCERLCADHHETTKQKELR